MRKITEDEFRDYLELKKFMNEVPGAAKGKTVKRHLSLDQLDEVRAARGDQEFAMFMDEMRARKEKEEK
ncbi:MAG: hypothetical protein IJ109_07005 [Firmicutes bacterium]|nr:hypothetical protein [Bacillota bacterium]